MNMSKEITLKDTLSIIEKVQDIYPMQSKKNFVKKDMPN